MNTISNQEIERQYRVLRQTLEMHSMLYEEYRLKATFSKILLLFCSVIFCATAFASDQLYLTLNLTPEISRIILGIASVLAFCFSPILFILDWQGKSVQHKDAIEKWSNVLKEFRKRRKDNKTWSEYDSNILSEAYWEADRNTVIIPNRRFNGLKSRYLRKVEMSKLKSSYPACPRLFIFFIIIFRDTWCAIHKIKKNV